MYFYLENRYCMSLQIIIIYLKIICKMGRWIHIMGEHHPITALGA